MLVAVAVFASCAKKYSEMELTSPDGRIKLTVTAGDTVRYAVEYDGQQVIRPSAIALHLQDGRTHGINPGKFSLSKGSASETTDAPFHRQQQVSAQWNYASLRFDGGWGLSFRVYDNGAAWRFETESGGNVIIRNETAQFLFEGDPTAWVPYSQGTDLFANSYQSQYTCENVSDFGSQSPLSLLPVALRTESGARVLVTESDLRSYPGMFLRGIPGGYEAVFANLPDSTYTTPARMAIKIGTRHSHIAETEGTRTYPWRIIAIEDNDTGLATNDLVYLLAERRKYDDVSWIRPGQVAWEWWNGYGLADTDFTPGVNTPTYKAYIDFASKFGIAYIIIDEGWSAKDDIMSVKDDVNLKELVTYGAERNVGIIIWAVSNVLDDKLEEACSYYSSIGIKGFKVDFFDRDDQYCVDLVYRLAECTAKHRMMLDLHGIYKPTGLNRTYPHVINFEGVFGLEEVKWSNPDMPLYDVTFPFIRQMAGPVDYTQGAYINRTKENFEVDYNRPMSQGTRAHQVAAYVVFDSPLVMLCDSPSRYLADVPCTEFITSIPTVFEKTLVLAGEIGKYIVTARTKDGKWYVGAMTNWKERKVTIALDFLEKDKTYLVRELADAPDASGHPEKHIIREYSADAASEVSFDMAKGGGTALIITEKQ